MKIIFLGCLSKRTSQFSIALHVEVARGNGDLAVVILQGVIQELGHCPVFVVDDLLFALAQFSTSIISKFFMRFLEFCWYFCLGAQVSLNSISHAADDGQIHLCVTNVQI